MAQRGMDVILNVALNAGQAISGLNQLKSSVSGMGTSMSGEMGNANRKMQETSNTATGLKGKLSGAVSGVAGKVKSVSDSFTGLNGAISGAMGAAGMAGFKAMTVDLTVSRLKTKELMAATMGSRREAESFYNTLKAGTKTSVVQLDMMLNAMNGIKLGTGMSNESLKSLQPTIQKVGEACILMGDDTQHATFVMKEAMSGLNGDFQVLKDQFGITREKMLEAGWSGAADDIAGYQAALNKCMENMGDFSGVMDSTSGKLETIKKNFRTAGLNIGEQFVPYIDQAAQAFLDLQGGGTALSEAILWIGGGVSALAGIAPTISPIIDTFMDLKNTAGEVKDTLSAARDKINDFRDSDKYLNFKEKSRKAFYCVNYCYKMKTSKVGLWVVGLQVMALCFTLLSTFHNMNE